MVIENKLGLTSSADLALNSDECFDLDIVPNNVSYCSSSLNTYSSISKAAVFFASFLDDD